MHRDQFRLQMGLLGQQQHPFLADRIFEVFDRDAKGRLTFEEFASIMDVLINGNEDERYMFSFALMDIDKTGSISFDEFFNYFAKVIAHWNSLINTHVRLEKKYIRSIFDQIDSDGDGEIIYREYKEALRHNPDLIDWF